MTIRLPVEVPLEVRRPDFVVLAAKARAADAGTTSLQVEVSNTGYRACRPMLLEQGDVAIRARLSVSHEYLQQHGPIPLPELTVRLTVDLAQGEVLTLSSLDTLPHPVDAVLAMGGCWLVVADRTNVSPELAKGEGTSGRDPLSENRFVFPNT
jgi:hypothetical protein